MQHFRVLESWRLVAALGVMAFHFLRYAPADQRWMEDVLYRMLPLMDMFFMISGFLIMLRYGDGMLESRGSYLRFIGRRFARIYPVYFVTLIFFVIVGIAVNLGYVHSGWEGRFDFAKLPQNLLLIQGWGTSQYLTFNYVAWTLSAEWFCYLFFPLIVLAWHRAGVAGLVVLCAAMIAILHAAMLADLIQEGHWLITYHLSAYRAFADFSIGALVAVLVRSSPWTLRSHLPGWTVFLAALVAMLAHQDPYISLALLALAVFLAALAERNNPEGARLLLPVHPLGQVSFGIYILHPVVEIFFFSVVWRMWLEPLDTMSFFVYWFAPMLVSIALALASSRWFERPVGRWMVGWFEGTNSRRRIAIAPAE